MTPRSELLTRTIVLPDGSMADAPYDPRCGACRSPWIPQIDHLLASGLTPAAIRSDLSGRRPACPNAAILRRHIAHLAERQREMRLLLEEPERSQVGTSDVINQVLALGYQALAEGRLELSGADWMRALQLRVKIEQTEQQHATAQAWQAAFMAFFEIVRRYLPPAEWQAFAAECYASPEILAVSQAAPPAPGPVP